jgi:hypothetical protein
MKRNFQMLNSWPNNFFAFFIHKLRPKHIFNVCGVITTLFDNVRLVWKTLTN